MQLQIICDLNASFQYFIIENYFIIIYLLLVQKPNDKLIFIMVLSKKQLHKLN